MRDAAPDWFDRPRAEEPGLRFACTQCGNCCTGAPGYVLFSEDEGRAMAAELGVPHVAFLDRYTRETPEGRSLREVRTEHGHDCVLLDRTSRPGKAICSVYTARPTQCRTWPFWPENLRSRRHWQRAAQTCPGIGRGPLHSPETVRLRLGEDLRTGQTAERDT